MLLISGTLICFEISLIGIFIFIFGISIFAEISNIFIGSTNYWKAESHATRGRPLVIHTWAICNRQRPIPVSSQPKLSPVTNLQTCKRGLRFYWTPRVVNNEAVRTHMQTPPLCRLIITNFTRLLPKYPCQWPTVAKRRITDIPLPYYL